MKESLHPQGIFLSQILDQTVVSADRKKVGTVVGVLVDMGVTFPRVDALAIDTPARKKPVFLSLTELDELSEHRICTHQDLANIHFSKLEDHLQLLHKSILDKQIVDINNIRVVRVNDIELIKVEDALRFVAVDCGLSGLLRRLKLLRLFRKIPWLKNRLSETLISWSDVQPLQSDADDLRLKVSTEKLSRLHPADLAHIMSMVHQDEQTAIVESVSDETLADVLPHLDEETQVDILESLQLDRALKVIEEMPSDDAVDLLGDVSDEKAEAILGKMDPEDKEDIEELLQHEDDTAGGLMNPDFIAFNKKEWVSDVFAKLRELKPAEEMFYYIYVVDDEDHLLGVITLQGLVLAEPGQCLSELIGDKVPSVRVDEDTDTIGKLVSKYNLLALPVVDADHKMLGVITVDDVVEQFIPSGFRKKRDVSN